MLGRATELSVRAGTHSAGLRCLGGAADTRVELGGIQQLEKKVPGAGTGAPGSLPQCLLNQHTLYRASNSHTEQVHHQLLKNVLPDYPLKNP